MPEINSIQGEYLKFMSSKINPTNSFFSIIGRYALTEIVKKFWQ